MDIKKFIVSITLGFLAIAAQANTILSGFYIDTVDPFLGGDSVVHYDDGSFTWSQHFRVHIAPYAQIFNNPDPDFTIPDWITPVSNGGAWFTPNVELFAAWGSNNEVLAASMGNGVDYSFNNWPVIFFSDSQSSWDVQLYTPVVVSSVPEPETYALMLAGLLGIMTTIRQKKTGKSNLSTN